MPIRHISVKFFSTETSEALAMRAGEIDIAFPLNGKTFAATAGAGERITTWSPPNVELFAMNVKAAPWSDIHVRRAVAYALNRADLITANGGPRTATSASTIITPAQLGTIGTSSQVNALLSALPQYPYDPAKARQELAESAYPHGFSATTEIDPGIDANVVQVIAAELQKIGITLKVDQVTFTQYVNDYNGPVGGNMYGPEYAASPDPSILPSYVVGGSVVAGDTAHYESASVNALLAAGLATSSPAKRLSIYRQVLADVATDEPYVVLFNLNAYTALSSGFTLPPFSVYPAFTSWALHIRLAA